MHMVLFILGFEYVHWCHDSVCWRNEILFLINLIFYMSAIWLIIKVQDIMIYFLLFDLSCY